MSAALKPVARPDPAEACAQAVLAQVPLLMREIRSAMRQAAPEGLTVPQFRALLFAQREPDGPVGALAAHLGVTLPTASVAVAALAQRGLLRVQTDPADRRRKTLRLTAEGRRIVEAAWARTAAGFAQRLSALPPSQLLSTPQALNALAGALISRS